GDSGAGKSTTIAALAQRGHEVIADDECFLRLDNNATIHAWPGVCQIRLWGDVRAVLGFDELRFEREMSRHSKCLIPIRPPRDPMQSCPLHRVYQLHRGLANSTTEVCRLDGIDAVEVLLQNIYPPGVAFHLGYQSNVFAVCAAAARDVPVFRLSRPWDLAALDESIDLLESHMLWTP